MALPVPVEVGPVPTTGPLVDRYARVHDYLRVSVTDRCNFRCTYCMPAEGLQWMPRAHLLTFEEIVRVVGALADMGVRRVRLTGGEPTLRRGLPELVRSLVDLGLDEVTMTTNGHAFTQHAEALATAGLTRINLSLDTLDPERFTAITRGGRLDRVLASIDAARAAGLTPIKINCVVMRGFNDDEVVSIVDAFAEQPDVQVRFIEYMPFEATGSTRQHVPVSRIRAKLAERYTLTPIEPTGGGPSRDVRLRDGRVVGFISPITEHFCERCNRLRLSADGHLRTCLSREPAPSLRDVLRDGVDDDGLKEVLRGRVWAKVAGHEAHLDGDFRSFEGVMTRVGG